MADIVITEFMDEAAIDVLRARFDVLYDPGLADRQSEIPAGLGNARALIVRNRTQVTANLLDAAPQLMCVGRLGVGLDNIDISACAKRGVTVYPATGANTQSVAEYVIVTAAILLRRAYSASDLVRSGNWPRAACGSGFELGGRTLGLVGFGEIARATARLAQAFGMTITAYDPLLSVDSPHWAGVTQLSLEALLAGSDVISLHVPLNDATRHMINAQTIASMKKDAILINAARGGVVEDAAVATALRMGHLGGAALDVFETEPVSAVSGLIFADCPSLILTPHIAGVTEDSNIRVSNLIADRVISHLTGGH